MELSRLTQLTVSNELLLTQIPFGLFLLSENLHFFSRMHLLPILLIYYIY